MSGSAIFSGGQIAVVSLLNALGGRPFQARIDETFKPAAGGPVQQRTVRLQVNSRRCVRFDVEQGTGPQVAFINDSVNRMRGGGISDQAETWSWVPWRTTLRPTHSADGKRKAPAASDAVLVEGVPCLLSEFEGGGTTSRHRDAPELGIPLRIETVNTEGDWLFRVHDIRYQEPESEQFPTPGNRE